MSKKSKKFNRRSFVKTVAAGAGSITFVKHAVHAQEAESLPPVVNLLLDDDPCREVTQATQVLTADNPGVSQNVPIPEGATKVRVVALGAGGSGSDATINSDGSTGGSGGYVQGEFNLSLLTTGEGSVSSLSVSVGEGGQAGIFGDRGTGGAFGGATGGSTIRNSEAINAPAHGGSGGGFSRVLAGEAILAVAGGGGGAGGASTTAETAGGLGGAGAAATSSARAGTAGDGVSISTSLQSFGRQAFDDNGGQGATGASDSFSFNGSNAEGIDGGQGGSNTNGDSQEFWGGAGGGGGGGFSTNGEFGSGGGGGGAGSGFMDEGTFYAGGGGGGGAGGSNYINTALVLGEFDDRNRGGSGGAGGMGGNEGLAGESGGDGRVEITFIVQQGDC